MQAQKVADGAIKLQARPLAAVEAGQVLGASKAWHPARRRASRTML